MQFYQIII
jgi:hypothetical protein